MNPTSVHSSAVPNRLDGSQPNHPWAQQIDFGTTELDIGTVTDADAIDYTLNSPDTNTVLWMHPDQQGIIVGTESGEWLVQALKDSIRAVLLLRIVWHESLV